MNTPNPETQLPPAGRMRRSYSDEFKSQVVKACCEPGVSTAAVALANDLNANLLRRWVIKTSQCNEPWPSKTPTTLAAACPQAAFMPVKLQSTPPVPTTTQADIRIELQHAKGAIQIHWPMAASSQCAQWLREVLA